LVLTAAATSETSNPTTPSPRQLWCGDVPLPLNPPLMPQLARSRAALPEGDGWAYEPKYDGFRAVAFVDGDETYLQSRNGKPLSRYFPELVFAPGRYVLDGEIVAASFDTLGQRIHPAASRIARLAEETPATYYAFDLLALDDEVLLERSYDERRAALEAHVADPVVLTDVVRRAADAEHWLHEAEGVIAKDAAAPYLPGERTGMIKVKRVRTVDAVVLGWRPGKAERTVGALILGLYDGQRLREVGHSSGFTAKEKRELVDKLAPYETGERGSGEPSRWTQGRDLEWVALRPELVVEITFDHVSDGRIRHGAKVQRWREDKAPEACTVDQLDQ
jgi:ATP-dependent DNA ligase